MASSSVLVSSYSQTRLLFRDQDKTKSFIQSSRGKTETFAFTTRVKSKTFIKRTRVKSNSSWLETRDFGLEVTSLIVSYNLYVDSTVGWISSIVKITCIQSQISFSYFRYEGLRGFFKGLAPYMCHVTPNICIVFLIYELVAGSNR